MAAIFDQAANGRIPAAVEALALSRAMPGVLPPLLSVQQARHYARMDALWRAFVDYHHAADKTQWHTAHPAESRAVLTVLKVKHYAAQS